MRILILASRDPRNPALGGGETVFAEFAKALVAKGHDVSMICAKFPSAPRHERVDGVDVIRAGSETILGAAACLTYRRQFRGRVDLVLEDFLGGARIPFAAPLYVREPLIAVWFQDHLPIFRNEYPRIAFPVLAGLERGLLWLHRRSPMLVCSGMTRDGLLAKGFPPEQIYVYLPGIPDALRSVGPPLPARERAPRLVCLGKIRRYKCQHHALLVLRRILPDVRDASLVIAGRVGDAAYLEEMRSLAREPDLAGHVSFELNVSEDRKRELLRTSRALLAPAPIEGFGIALVEASACGLPVVGTTGVPEDALKEGVNGFRVPFADHQAMAERAEILLRDDARLDAMASSAVSFAQAFTWERAARPLLGLLPVAGSRGT